MLKIFFQVSAFESLVSKESWSTFPTRVEKNTLKILEILNQFNIKATFFTLGWIAENHPSLIQQIHLDGHEIACHSYSHRLVYNLTPEEFLHDTKKSKDILEQLTGTKVNGYRAPSYSITKKSLWALQILNELGFSYDSSIFPIHHDRYGLPEAPRHPFTWELSSSQPEIIQQPQKTAQSQGAYQLIEYPISTSLLFGRKIPVSGGGYFRLFPYWFTRTTLKKSTTRNKNHSYSTFTHGNWTLNNHASIKPLCYLNSDTIIIYTRLVVDFSVFYKTLDFAQSLSHRKLHNNEI